MKWLDAGIAWISPTRQRIALLTLLKRKKVVLLIVIVAISGVILYQTGLFSFIPHWDVQQILNLANDNTILLLLITLFLMIIQNLLAIIPLLLLISINISVFGFMYGYLWSIMTSILGAIIAFYIVRSGFQRFFLKVQNQRLIHRFEKSGFYFVLIGRLLPLVPSSMINAAGGISTISFRKFISGTIIGNIVYVFVLALISSGFISFINN